MEFLKMDIFPKSCHFFNFDTYVYICNPSCKIPSSSLLKTRKASLYCASSSTLECWNFDEEDKKRIWRRLKKWPKRIWRGGKGENMEKEKKWLKRIWRLEKCHLRQFLFDLWNVENFMRAQRAYILKVQKSAESAFQSQKICGKHA